MLCLTCPSSAVTYVRVGIDVGKVLIPRILKVAIPVGFAVFAYVYTQRQRSVV